MPTFFGTVVVLLFGFASAFLNSPASFSVKGHHRKWAIKTAHAIDRRTTECQAVFGVRMSNVPGESKDALRNALVLKKELEDELPQLFDLKYTPKWNLYANEVDLISRVRQANVTSASAAGGFHRSTEHVHGNSKV